MSLDRLDRTLPAFSRLSDAEALSFVAELRHDRQFDKRPPKEAAKKARASHRKMKDVKRKVKLTPEAIEEAKRILQEDLNKEPTPNG